MTVAAADYGTTAVTLAATLHAAGVKTRGTTGDGLRLGHCYQRIRRTLRGTAMEEASLRGPASAETPEKRGRSMKSKSEY